MKRTKLGALCLALLLALSAAGCSGKRPKIEEVESLTQVVTEGELHALKEYPNLKTLDVSGSTCYPAILKFMEDRPQVDVTYTVALGSGSISNKATTATLAARELDFDTLHKNLRYLPNLQSLTLSGTTLTPSQLDQLASAYPKLTLAVTVELLGTEYPSDATQVDLGGLTPEQIPQAIQGLTLLPHVTQAELMDSGGMSSLTMTDVRQLMDAFPNIQYHYRFDLFGKTLSTTDETVEYVKVSIGNEGEEQIRQALDILPNCTYFKLDSCGIDNAVMSGLREDYPDTKVVWRVTFGRYSALTDAQMIRAVYHVYNDTAQVLRYCNEVKYLDLGHNEELSDFSFINHMPELEIAILSGSLLDDLSCFAGCPNLEFLEIAYCSKVTDLSPLENCENLRFLNISFTKAESLAPLDNLPLERFVYLKPKANYEEQQFFITFHPDCWTRFTGEDPYTLGWRYDDQGKTFSEYYQKMREIFGYDEMN